MSEFIDQLGRSITLGHSPKRIISVVPSQTEFLADLGLENEVVGITKFCIHPEKWFRTKERIGGTKELNIEKIRSLKPDLIIANKEENLKSDIDILINEFPVWISDIQTLEDSLQMMVEVGKITGKEEKAIEIASIIKEQFSTFREKVKNNTEKKVAYFIWRKPYMSIGKDTFIHQMLHLCNYSNVFSDQTRYPEITEALLKEANPDLIFLSSEPYPFKEKHFEEFKAICPSAKVILVDGEMFSWYGSRLLESPAYFEELCLTT